MTHKILFIVLALATCTVAHPQSAGEKSVQNSTATVERSNAKTPELDIAALVKETEQVDFSGHKIGIFWWVPPDYWESALRQQGYNYEQVQKTFQPFKSYNLFIVAVGELGIGDISWSKDLDIKRNLVLRDESGVLYKPIEETPDDMSAIIEVMKPVFKNMMGNFGGGLQFILFPIKDGKGKVIVDFRKSSEVFLDVSALMGTSIKTYTWRFPLTTLSPPKYCPAGKERVEASWKYCPWHGVKLSEDTSPKPSATTTEPAKP